jgi:hypothetical protein
MRRFFGNLGIGLAVLCALGTARPASADTFTDAVDCLRNTILSYGDCFECGGESTLLNLLAAARAQHVAGNNTLAKSILNQALMCANTPSRDIFRLISCTPTSYTVGPSGVPTPISQVMACFFGCPVPVYKIFSYTVNGFINLDQYKKCRCQAHDPIEVTLGYLISLI